MPYLGHARLTLNGIFGTLAQPVEIFSFGFCMSNLFGGAPPAGYMDAYVAAASAFFADPGSYIGDQCFLTQVKLAQIGITGKYQSPPDVRNVSVQGGANSGVIHPPQTAWVVSLNARTATRHQKGRFYLPGPRVAIVGATQRTAATAPGEVATAVHSFLQAVNAIDPQRQVIVASRSAINTVVTSVRVGNVVDTMRTRRDKLRETYSEVVL